MENPFDSINERLSNIEKILEEIKTRKPDVPIPSEFLTPQEMAEKLKVSLVTLWSWDKKGILHPVYFGNAKRYCSIDLENAVKASQK